MNKINYQKELDRVIDKIMGEGKVPKLLLHVCCAPCSSYCLEYLSKYFDITVYFYNPNISIADEYNYRLSEEKRLVSLMPFEHPVKVVEGEYLPKDYFEYVKGLENEPEGGKRCENVSDCDLNPLHATQRNTALIISQPRLQSVR